VANWIKFGLSGADKLQAELQNKTSQLQAALSVKVNALLFQLQTKIIMKIGQSLKRRTGALVNSVKVLEQATPEKISGSVGIPHGQTYPYAAAHELGHEGAYRITATRAKALAFQLSVKANAEKVFARYVTHPPIPALGFVSSTREENREDILRELQETVNEVLKRK
jgi:hypothetical protein